MYLRHTTRKKDGKVHRYWSLVRSVRVGRRVIQQTVEALTGRVPKWRVVADECKAARDKLRAHLAETKAERSQSIPNPNRRRR